MDKKAVCSADQIPGGEMKKFDIDELEVTVANIEGEFFAFEDRCPHMNSPLSRGKLDGEEVVCPFHKARFNVKTGKKTAEPKVPVPKVIKMGALMHSIRTHDMRTFAVSIQNGQITIEI